MQTIKKNQPVLFVIVVYLLCSQTTYAQGQWMKRGSDSLKYEMRMDESLRHKDKPVMTIKSQENEISGFGTYMQRIIPGKYVGKRVKLSGHVKSKDISDWAGLWIRVDQTEPKKMLAFDNMDERPIKGTSDWTKYELVVDVPATASFISFGALLGGTGQIWFDDLQLEIVPDTTPLTGNKTIE